MSWVIPDGKSSDHSYASDGSGPSWVASVVNAIGNSQYWANTAIFITWDDWGGWYDHVAPSVINSYEYGFRVPLIVVSPYAKANYISHTTHHFGSILKFIEETFSLSSLNYADANADDFSDCFDFSQTPLTFQTINRSAECGSLSSTIRARPPIPTTIKSDRQCCSKSQRKRRPFLAAFFTTGSSNVLVGEEPGSGGWIALEKVNHQVGFFFSSVRIRRVEPVVLDVRTSPCRAIVSSQQTIGPRVGAPRHPGSLYRSLSLDPSSALACR